MTDPIIVLEAAAMAAVASIILYSKRYADTKEPWRPAKFAATVLVGVACGVALAFAGEPVTQATIEARLAAYAGVVVLVESAGKAVHRSITEARGR